MDLGTNTKITRAKKIEQHSQNSLTIINSILGKHNRGLRGLIQPFNKRENLHFDNDVHTSSKIMRKVTRFEHN